MTDTLQADSFVAKLASTPEGRRRLLQQKAILRAGDVIERAMQETGVSQAALAKKLGKSKSWVSQLLSEQNMTVRTVADVLAVLGHELHFSSRAFSVGAPKIVMRIVEWPQPWKGSPPATVLPTKQPLRLVVGDWRRHG